MVRIALTSVAAAIMTFGTVSALYAEDAPVSKVTVAPNGDYCVTDPAVTGSRIQPSECHPQAVWAKQGVTFARKPATVVSR